MKKKRRETIFMSENISLDITPPSPNRKKEEKMTKAKGRGEKNIRHECDDF
jgi:hypothetical protein